MQQPLTRVDLFSQGSFSTGPSENTRQFFHSLKTVTYISDDLANYGDRGFGVVVWAI